VLKRKVKTPTLTPTRLDTWDRDHVFELLETSVANSGQWIHGYRTVPDMREAYLEMLSNELQQGLMAVQSLRRRL
jgi:hypothetical protein